MDDKNTTPETSPENTPATPTAPASAEPAATAPVDSRAAAAAETPVAEASVAHQAPVASAPKRRRGRGLLIAGGAVLGGLLLAGGGVAVGAAIAGDLDDDDDTVSSASDDRDHDERGDGSRDDDATSGDARGDLSNLGTDSADDLVAMMDAATAAAEGEPTSIDMKRDGGAEVTLEGADGAETEVRVDAEGAASVASTEPADSDDTAPQNVLDAATIDAIVTAALAEADGRIVEIEADDDGDSPWDVTVLTSAGEFVEIDLDAQYAVVATRTER